MNKIMKECLKQIKRKIYEGNTLIELGHIHYTIVVLQLSCNTTTDRDELNQLIKLRKQLDEKMEIIKGISENINGK